jgi:hypothetical protein
MLSFNQKFALLSVLKPLAVEKAFKIVINLIRIPFETECSEPFESSIVKSSVTTLCANPLIFASAFTAMVNV